MNVRTGLAEFYFKFAECYQRLRALCDAGYFCVIGKNKDGQYIIKVLGKPEDEVEL